MDILTNDHFLQQPKKERKKDREGIKEAAEYEEEGRAVGCVCLRDLFLREVGM